MTMEITLLISAGSGPRECHFAAQGIARAYAKEAAAAGHSALLLESQNPGSCLLRIKGGDLAGFLAGRCGTVQWVGQSPFRKNHKRKNWFVGVFRLPEPDQITGLDPNDVTFTATRASGPGGQHVNKTNSAVRAVHGPTGFSVTAVPSQGCPKKTSCQIWCEEDKALERGNPVRVYVGEKFKRRN